MNDTNERRFEWISLFKNDIEENAVLALLLLQHQQVIVKRRVGIDGKESNVPLVDRIIHQLYRIDVTFERIRAVNVAEFLHQSVGRLHASGHRALNM